jgi:dihydrofolate synthase/folylpolyglutamate synthase
MSSHCESYRQAIQFLYGLRWFGAKFGLENTFKLAALAEDPQNQLCFIHVAGTNGKGSTCAMLESIYRAAGLRVGLFTSPHLVSFRERIQVNRELISEADVVRLVEELRLLVATGVPPAQTAERRSPDRPGPGATVLQRADQEIGAPLGGQEAHPTFFEFITVLALRYFAEQQCDLVIWETGLGGRLDATNIVTPLASVITNIGFDHQQWLGETLAQIATEKAGIIKPGIPVVTAEEGPETLQVIARIAQEKNAPLTKVGQASRLSRAGATPALPLLGEHQRLNAALAVAMVEALQEKIPVSNDAIRIGLETVHWPGRLQLVKTASGQTILLDGAHNVGGAEALRRALVGLFSAPKPALVLGVLQDKDYRHICETLAPLAGRIVTVPVASERTAPPEALCDVCREANPAALVTACSSLADALSQVADDLFVVITGSLYLVGEAMELLKLSPATDGSERELNEWTVRK